jgi:hypothetical protein
MLWDGLKERNIFALAIILVGVVATGLVILSPTMAQAEGTIVEDWANAKAPPPVELKPVTVNVKETAFLILDIEERTCNAERRPRCVASGQRSWISAPHDTHPLRYDRVLNTKYRKTRDQVYE